MKVLQAIGLAFATFSAMLLFGLVWAAIIRWAWNSTMPQIFGLIEINYWQAYAISVLAGMFGGKGIHQELKNN